MKNFAKENSKSLIYAVALVISVTIIASIGFSYAADDNNNIIYTRDELSEMMNETIIKNNYARIYYSEISINSPTNTVLESGTECLTKNPDILSCNDGKILVNRTGEYEITFSGAVYFTTTTGYAEVATSTSSGIGFSGIDLIASSYSKYKRGSTSLIFRLNEGTEMTIRYKINEIGTLSGYLSVTYLSD